MSGVPYGITQHHRIEVDEDHPVARQEDMVGLEISVNRGGRHLLQPGRHGGGNRPNVGGELGPRPLDDGRPPPQLLELDRQRAARHGAAPDVVLIECRYGPGRDAQWTGRVMTLPQQVQQRGAGSLLQHQGAQVFAVGNGAHHGVAGLAPLDALPEGLQQLERVLAVVVAIHLHEAPQRCGAPRRRVARLQRVLERGAELRAVARGGLAAAEPHRDASLDVIAFPRRRLEMATEQLEHPLRVARDRELGEIGIGREAARAHPRDLARHPHRLAHRSKSPAGCPRLSSYRRRYRPLRVIRSLCVPRSMMRPSSSTSTKSASVIEGRSCVIMRQVLPAIRRSSAWRTVASLSTSRPVMGSSRIRIGALRMSARAMAMRCRCPPDRVAPRSPMTVSYPSSSRRMNSWALAALAAAMISSTLASGRPYAMFSRMVAPNSSDCWSTSPIWRRNDSRRYWRMSSPSTRIAPSWASYRRRIRLTMVDLPAPDAPTKASRCPGATLKETCRSTSLPSP